MTLITIDGILYIPIIKGAIFWLFYSLFHLSFGSTKDFLTELNSPLFGWLDFIVVILFSFFAEKVLPKTERIKL